MSDVPFYGSRPYTYCIFISYAFNAVCLARWEDSEAMLHRRGDTKHGDGGCGGTTVVVFLIVRKASI